MLTFQVIKHPTSMPPIDDHCPITRQMCFWVRYNQNPCSTNPGIHDAANCINALTAILSDRENEIVALDDLVEKLKEKPASDAADGEGA